jgi:hypothetical protein
MSVAFLKTLKKIVKSKIDFSCLCSKNNLPTHVRLALVRCRGLEPHNANAVEGTGVLV